MRLAEGTVSILVGCHSPVHAICVAVAWRRIHGRWPTWKEAVCILLHDIGHLGLDYLSDPAAKARHWRLGAALAGCLLGEDAYDLIAGHSPSASGRPESALYRPDKLSWSLAPTWILICNAIVEPKLVHPGDTIMQHVRDFRWRVRQNCAGEWRETHAIYQEMQEGRHA